MGGKATVHAFTGIIKTWKRQGQERTWVSDVDPPTDVEAKSGVDVSKG